MGPPRGGGAKPHHPGHGPKREKRAVAGSKGATATEPRARAGTTGIQGWVRPPGKRQGPPPWASKHTRPPRHPRTPPRAACRTPLNSSPGPNPPHPGPHPRHQAQERETAKAKTGQHPTPRKLRPQTHSSHPPPSANTRVPPPPPIPPTSHRTPGPMSPRAGPRDHIRTGEADHPPSQSPRHPQPGPLSHLLALICRQSSSGLITQLLSGAEQDPLTLPPRPHHPPPPYQQCQTVVSSGLITQLLSGAEQDPLTLPPPPVITRPPPYQQCQHGHHVSPPCSMLIGYAKKGWQDGFDVSCISLTLPVGA
ncbi:basic proline-rich protein-like [Thalassophryne amazonica]|uniref:basic proline-rich protein-like n=1 Tax=Thalassophryne amazonica TaxID=390379 RepID=UPI0014709161|nr:basic proline-rich protein-like [Thalassophryne amazonica]